MATKNSLQPTTELSDTEFDDAFSKLPKASPSAKDYGKLLGVSALSTLGGITKGADILTGGAVDSVTGAIAGKGISDILSSGAASLRETVSPGMKESLHKRFVTRENKMGKAWGDPHAWAGKLTESAIPSIAGIVPALRIASTTAKASKAAALARGLTEKAAQKTAQKAAQKAAIVTGGVAEGGIAGGMAATQVEREIMQMSQETLATNPAYQKLIKEGATPESARKSLADSAARQTFAMTAPAVGATGYAFNKYLGKLISSGATGGRLRAGATGAAIEAPTEMVQSGAEQAIHNLSIQQYGDPTRPTGQDVPEAIVSGGLLGAVMGGGVGTALGGRAPEQAAQEQAAQEEPLLWEGSPTAPQQVTRTRAAEVVSESPHAAGVLNSLERYNTARQQAIEIANKYGVNDPRAQRSAAGVRAYEKQVDAELKTAYRRTIKEQGLDQTIERRELTAVDRGRQEREAQDLIARSRGQGVQGIPMSEIGETRRAYQQAQDLEEAQDLIARSRGQGVQGIPMTEIGETRRAYQQAKDLADVEAETEAGQFTARQADFTQRAQALRGTPIGERVIQKRQRAQQRYTQPALDMGLKPPQDFASALKKAEQLIAKADALEKQAARANEAYKEAADKVERNPKDVKLKQAASSLLTKGHKIHREWRDAVKAAEAAEKALSPVTPPAVPPVRTELKPLVPTKTVKKPTATSQETLPPPPKQQVSDEEIVAGFARRKQTEVKQEAPRGATTKAEAKRVPSSKSVAKGKGRETQGVSKPSVEKPKTVVEQAQAKPQLEPVTTDESYTELARLEKMIAAMPESQKKKDAQAQVNVFRQQLDIAAAISAKRKTPSKEPVAPQAAEDTKVAEAKSLLKQLDESISDNRKALKVLPTNHPLRAKIEGQLVTFEKNKKILEKTLGALAPQPKVEPPPIKTEAKETTKQVVPKKETKAKPVIPKEISKPARKQQEQEVKAEKAKRVPPTAEPARKLGAGKWDSTREFALAEHERSITQETHKPIGLGQQIVRLQSIEPPIRLQAPDMAAAKSVNEVNGIVKPVILQRTDIEQYRLLSGGEELSNVVQSVREGGRSKLDAIVVEYEEDWNNLVPQLKKQSPQIAPWNNERQVDEPNPQNVITGKANRITPAIVRIAEIDHIPLDYQSEPKRAMSIQQVGLAQPIILQLVKTTPNPNNAKYNYRYRVLEGGNRLIDVMEAQKNEKVPKVSAFVFDDEKVWNAVKPQLPERGVANLPLKLAAKRQAQTKAKPVAPAPKKEIDFGPVVEKSRAEQSVTKVKYEKALKRLDVLTAEKGQNHPETKTQVKVVALADKKYQLASAETALATNIRLLEIPGTRLNQAEMGVKNNKIEQEIKTLTADIKKTEKQPTKTKPKARKEKGQQEIVKITAITNQAGNKSIAITTPLEQPADISNELLAIEDKIRDKVGIKNTSTRKTEETTTYLIPESPKNKKLVKDAYQGYLKPKGDKGKFALRETPITTPVSVEAISKVTERIGKQWRGAPSQIEVVENFVDLPKAVQNAASKQNIQPDQIRGVYHDGTQYIVRGNIGSAQEVEEVLFHEALHDALARKHESTKALSGALNTLFIRMRGQEGIDKFAQRHGVDLSQYKEKAKGMPAQARRALLVEELLASIEGSRAYKSLPQKIKQAIKEFWGAMRAWANEHGFHGIARLIGTNLDNLNDADIAYLLRDLRQGLRRTAPNISRVVEQPVRFAMTAPASILEQAYAKAGLGEDKRSLVEKTTDMAKEAWTATSQAARDRYYTETGSSVDKRSVTEKTIGIAKEAWTTKQAARSRLTEGIFDKFHGIKLAEQTLGNLPVEQSGYVGARLSTGVSSIMYAVLNHGAPQWRDGILSKVPDSKGLLEILEPVKDQQREFFGWMVGRRAARLMSEGKEHNLNAQEIDELLRLHQPAFNGKADPLAEGTADSVDGQLEVFKSRILDVAEQAGLIDPVARQAWEHFDYIPFYRVTEKGVKGARKTQGLSHQSAQIQKLVGGTSELNNPMENLLQNFTHLIDASLKNHAIRLTVDNLKPSRNNFITELEGQEKLQYKQALIPLSQVKSILREKYQEAGLDPNMVKLIPSKALKGMAQMWAVTPPKAPDIVRVMDRGEARYFRVHEPALLRGLTAVNQEPFGGVVKGMRWFKRLLTNAVTADPSFMIRNFMRDMLHAWTINPDHYKLGMDSFRGAAKTLKEQGGYIDMMFSGASFMGGYVNANDPKDMADAIRRALTHKGFTKAQTDSYMKTVVLSAEDVWHKWRSIGDAIENASREAVFEAGGKKGKGRAQTAFESKDLMDYSMQGNFAIIRLMGDVLPFFNARLQGLYKLGRAGGIPLPKLARQHVIIKGGLIALASVGLLALNWDNDRYKELPDWDKDVNWHFFFGDEHVRIPKPFEIGLLYGSVPERAAQLMFGHDDLKDSVDFIFSSTAHTLAFNPLPQAVRPMAEVFANRNMFRNTPIENMSDEGKLPGARYNEFTSETMRELGNALGLSPKQLQHVWQGYLGSLGMYVLGTSDWVVREIMGMPDKPTMRADDYWVLKSFLRGEPARNTQYRTDFYDMFKEVEETWSTIRALHKEQQVERAAQLMEKNKEKLKYRKPLRKIYQSLRSIRQKTDMIMRDRKITPEQKRTRIDLLTRKANVLTKRAVTMAGAAF